MYTRNTISAGAEWHSAARPPFSRPSVSLPLGIDLFQGPARPIPSAQHQQHTIATAAATAADDDDVAQSSTHTKVCHSLYAL